MRIGVVNGDAIDVLQHSIGQNAVQVKGHDNRNGLSEDLARFLQQVAFGVELVLRAHCPVHREIDAVYRRRCADCIQKLTGDRVPGIGGEQSV